MRDKHGIKKFLTVIFLCVFFKIASFEIQSPPTLAPHPHPQKC